MLVVQSYTVLTRVVSESDRRQYALPTPPKWSWSMGHQSPFWTGLVADRARASWGNKPGLFNQRGRKGLGRTVFLEFLL